MSTDNKTKINHLLSTQPSNSVLLSFWLKKQGYNHDLQKRYRKSRWFESIGTGALIRTGDSVRYEGAIYALQKQAGLSIHPGGRTALALLGKGHYLELTRKKVVIFGGMGEKLPSWFKRHDWGVEVEFHQTAFLPSDIGWADVELKNFSIQVSSAARAVMECLYLAPEKQDLIECYQLMEGLNNFRPDLIQQLLEKCRSVKVKRLFLYMAEMAAHAWVEYLNLKKIDLGRGKRSIVKNGVYVPKYQITVPKELEMHGKPSV